MAEADTYYRRPGTITRLVLNPAVALLTRSGLSIWGSRVLEVRGRSSGTVRRTPVNVLSHEGREFLVAARGETEWVRNVRAARGRLALVRGRGREVLTATELPDHEKPQVLRAYLRKWKLEVGAFFDGVGPDSPEEDLARIAPDHPVFVIERARISGVS